MKLTKVTFDKVNTVIILNHTIFAEFIFTFNAHPILCQHPLDIAIVFLDVLGNVINSLLVDFPTTVWIDLTTGHDVRLIEMLRQERAVKMLSKTWRHDTQGLVVVDSKEIYCVLTNKLQLLICRIWQQIMLS